MSKPQPSPSLVSEETKPPLIEPQEMVKEFHQRFRFPTNRNLGHEGLGQKGISPQGQKINVSKTLMGAGSQIAQLSATLLQIALPFQKVKDERTYRAHLITEEVSEVLTALAERDEIALADALTDLLYVVYGTFVTYSLPSTELFVEVHRSNMTKSRDEDDPRMKTKDPDRGYSAPEIEEAIRRGRIGE